MVSTPADTAGQHWSVVLVWDVHVASRVCVETLFEEQQFSACAMAL